MIIYDIEGIQLYQYETKYNKKFKKDITSLRLIKRDLEIGEVAYIENSDNKIKKISDSEYMIIRHDTISTHINSDNKVKYNLNDIKSKIVKRLDYSLEYADDRVELVDKLLSENKEIYNLVSTTRSIQKEIKSKKSFRSEEQPFDKLIEIISSYINYAKFKNEEDENEYNKKLQELEENKSKKKDIDNLEMLISEIQGYHHKLIKKQFKEDKRLEVISDFSELENQDRLLVSEEQQYRQKKTKSGYKKDEIPDNYWDNMGYNEESKFFRKDILNQMKNEINKLYTYIGLDIKDKKLRQEHRDKLVEKFNKNLPENFTSRFNGDRQLKVAIDMYNQLKGDYEVTKKILTDEINLKNISSGTTEYEINADTWYEDKNGEIIELSKNHILLSDANTYKGLILTYKDLKDKYQDKLNHDMWSLLYVFEELLEQTEFTQDEQFVLDMLFDSYNQKQIRDQYELVNLNSITKDRVSRLINTQIPNKILNTYLDSVEDWVYTEKIKGKYKECSKCGDIKLANDRYYSQNKDSNDNLHTVCKKCRSLGK